MLVCGPYRAPRLAIGSRASCLYRDRMVLVVGYTDARLPWPLCRPVPPASGGAGLLVEEELARAIRCESVLALRHWWGVGNSSAERWRRAFGVSRMGSEGSRRLILEAIDGLAKARAAGEGGVWSPEEEAMLGALPDHEVASRTGRTFHSVSAKRRHMGIAGTAPSPGVYAGKHWTPEEDGWLCRLGAEEAAARLGRSVRSVRLRQARLREWLA